MCEHLLEIFDFILAYYFTEKIDQKSIQSINFPYFFSFRFAILNGPSFGYQKFGSLIFGSWFFLVGFFRPPFCNSIDVICHRLWAVWKWFSPLKKSTSLLIGFGFWLAEWFRPFRTICPRRDRKRRNHLHPQLLPIHREAWCSHPWGFHLLLKWKKSVNFVFTARFY